MFQSAKGPDIFHESSAFFKLYNSIKHIFLNDLFSKTKKIRNKLDSI